MIIVMQAAASEEQVQHAIRRVEDAGLEAILLRGEPYKLASREMAAADTRVRLNGHVIGQERIAVIAGPCAVEDLERTLNVARRAKAAGATALRGGAYKPRTSPYSFQGLEQKGLEILAEVRRATGLPVVTEVLGAEHAEKVAAYADVLQVGARNMQNFLLLRAVGRTGKPVLLKRGFSATIEELLLAAEHVLKSGNPNVILCLRGIRTFEDHTRFTLSLSSVPYLKQVTHLPVIVDPSHGTGARSLVAPMCKAAVACGADGLLVEVHPDPETAAVDGAQSLTCEEFDTLMKELAPLALAVGRTL